MPPQVERRTVSIETLTRAAYNPRKIDKAEKAGLAASLDRFGLVQEIVVNRRDDDELRVVGGHQRLDVLQEKGTKKVPVAIVELDDDELRVVGGHQRLDVLQEKGTKKVPVAIVELDDDGEKALNLALNSHAITGTWDGGKLAELLDGLEKNAAQLFVDVRLEELWQFAEKATPAAGGDPDEVPEVEAVAITRPGEVWVMGEHRIICGSSTEAATVAKLLGDVKPHLMVTDPPYGVEYDATWRVDAMPEKNTGKDGGGTHGKVKNDDRADWREAWALFPGEVAYVWHAGNMAHVVAESLLASGFDIRGQIIWGKSNFVIGRGHYHPHHEPCWYAVRKGGTGHWQGDRTQSTLWAIDKPKKSETGHSTQKPVECMRKPIENNSARGDAVYEPFGGSGTTIIAGEMMGRRVYAVELHPPYVDIAVRRWQTLTGNAATLEGDGRTFAEVEAERRRAA